jgi:hypothetical protein
MGNLVFQATLGGQVNLVGPNTASTFNLNVPAVAGTLVTTGDTGTVTNTMCATSVYTAPGTIGSGTPNSGAFTTLSASSTVSGTGLAPIWQALLQLAGLRQILARLLLCRLQATSRFLVLAQRSRVTFRTQL